jgi:hypothetical protein
VLSRQTPSGYDKYCFYNKIKKLLVFPGQKKPKKEDNNIKKREKNVNYAS